MKFSYAVLLLCLVSLTSFAQWMDISSSRLDIVFVDQNIGWMVGAGGTILKTTNGGSTWINQHTPVISNQNITRLLVFDNGRSLRIVANNSSFFTRQGNIYSSSDGGASWKLDVKHSSDMIDAHFINASVGWYWVRDDNPGNEFVYKTTDGGITWALDASLTTVGNMFTYQLTTWVLLRIKGKSNLWKSTDQGVTWASKREITQHVSNWVEYPVMWFTDDQKGWMTNKITNQFYKTIDGGTSWQAVKYNPLQSNNFVSDIFFIDSQIGYIIAPDDKTQIFKTTDGGNTWNQVLKSSDVYNIRFNAIAFRDAEHGVVVGTNGFYSSTSDGGLTWTQANYCNAGSNFQIEDIAFNEDDVWLIGEGILHKSSNGHEWIVHTEMLHQDHDEFNSIDFGPQGKGTLVGELRYASSDNDGNTWTRKIPTFQYSPDFYRESVSYDSLANLWVVGVNGQLYKSVDNGISYKIKYSFPNNYVGVVRLFFQSKQKIWAIEDTRVLRSNDSGETWTKTNEAIAAFQFINSSIGWKILTNNKLYKTIDGGETWGYVSTINSLFESFFMFFADEKTGWIANKTAAVLKTADGGLTWNAETTGVSYQINGFAFKKNSQGKIIGYLGGRRLLKFAGEYSPLPIGNSDGQAPVLMSTIPAANAGSINTTASLSMSFNENVKLKTGNLRIFNAATDTQIQLLPLNVSNTAIEGANAIITLSAQLPTGTQLYIKVDPGVFDDNAGNPFTGISDKRWIFFTAAVQDAQPPTITSKSPLHGALNVSPETVLELNFNEEVTINNGILSVFDMVTNNEIQRISLNSSNTVRFGFKVTVQPLTQLPSGKSLYIKINNGAFKDLSGNLFAGISDKSWYFSTSTSSVDNSPPIIVSTNPASHTTSIDPETLLIINFNEPVSFVPGQVKAIYSSGGIYVIQTIYLTNYNTTIEDNKVTINPEQDLPRNTSLSIWIDKGIFKDAKGNLFAGINNLNTWMFTTTSGVDLQAPKLLSTIPQTSAIEVDPATPLTMQFDEPIVLLGGNFEIYRDPINTPIASFNLTSLNTLIDGAKLTIIPSQPLPNNEVLYIKMAPDVITDTIGNKFKGIVDRRWKFSTEKLITGISDESVSTQWINIINLGDKIVIATQDLSIVVLNVCDIVGRTIQYNNDTTTGEIVLIKPQGPFIVQYAKGNKAFAQKIMLQH